MDLEPADASLFGHTLMHCKGEGMHEMCLPSKSRWMEEILWGIVCNVMKFIDSGIFLHNVKKIVGVKFVMAGLF